MIRFVVALSCEARPLIRHFGLRSHPSHTAFPIFSSDRHSLVVTGVGKAAAAAGVSYLQLAIPGGPADGWLNCGIAGHSSRSRGEAIRAHKIEDADSGQSWYPPLQCPCAAESDTVRTVAKVESTFAEDCTYDMEASGFYCTAVRFSSSELVQCLKIVSDGPTAGSTAKIGRELCAGLIEAKLELIEDFARALEQVALPLQQDLSRPARLDKVLERWQLTFSQQQQVRTMLEKISARTGSDDLKLPEVRSTSDLISYLRAQLEASPLGVGAKKSSE